MPAAPINWALLPCFLLRFAPLLIGASARAALSSVPYRIENFRTSRHPFSSSTRLCFSLMQAPRMVSRRTPVHCGATPTGLLAPLAPDPHARSAPRITAQAARRARRSVTSMSWPPSTSPHSSICNGWHRRNQYQLQRRTPHQGHRVQKGYRGSATAPTCIVASPEHPPRPWPPSAPPRCPRCPPTSCGQGRSSAAIPKGRSQHNHLAKALKFSNTVPNGWDSPHDWSSVTMHRTGRAAQRHSPWWPARPPQRRSAPRPTGLPETPRSAARTPPCGQRP